jgi:transposase InsO family protein
VMRMKAKEKGGSSGGGSSGGGGDRGRGRGRGKGRGGGRNGGANSYSREDTSARGVCHNCGKMGHYTRECRSKKKGEAHMVQDDEPSLLLVEAGDVNTTLFSPPPPATALLIYSSGATLEKSGGKDMLGGGSGDSGCAACDTVHLVEDKVVALISDVEKEECRRWVLDTGTTNHMMGCRSAFSDLDHNVHGTVKFVDGSVVRIEGMGMVLFNCKNGEHHAFVGVYYIPKLNTNIISVGQLDEIGFQTLIEGGIMRIRDGERRLLAKVPKSANRLYVLQVEIATPVCLAMRGSENAWLWHARYGHLNFPALRKLTREEMVHGLPEVEHVDQVCGGCLTDKHRRASFPRQAEYRAEEILELVHGDLCGPITPATPSGSRYFLLLVNDRSRFMWLRMLRSKDQAADTIKQFQQIAEAETGRKLRAFRSDRGGEFNSIEFAEHCTEHGVRRQLTAPYSPQQNGVVERHNQMVVGTARSLLKSKRLPRWLWGEAVATAVYLLNRSPTRSVEGKTSFEVWYGKKPGVHHLRTFGCVVHVKNTTPNLKKLEDRSQPMIFIGYELGSKAYRAYDPVSKKVHVTRDVVFDEQALWNWGADAEHSTTDGGDTFIVETEYSTVV